MRNRAKEEMDDRANCPLPGADLANCMTVKTVCVLPEISSSRHRER